MSLKLGKYLLLCIIAVQLQSCDVFESVNRTVGIPQFNFPKTVEFAPRIGAYGIYSGDPVKLVPTEDYQLLELSSVLFTDYAYKQRLVKVPTGEQLLKNTDGSINFPDGSILVKTFFYYVDERDKSLGKNLIETRLLIKEDGKWNVATYLWDEAQTSAILSLNGYEKVISWIDETGSQQSTHYAVPNENECMTCHQVNSEMAPIGTRLRNLNRLVTRDGNEVNQLAFLQSKGILERFEPNSISIIVDYKDLAQPLELRARAYLDLNCAHCHNPSGWSKPNERDFDFRYEQYLGSTGLVYDHDKVIKAMGEGEMPFIGTTMIDHEGVKLIKAYIDML